MGKTVRVEVMDLGSDGVDLLVEAGGVRVQQWMKVGEELELPVTENVTLEIQSGSGKFFGGFK